MGSYYGPEEVAASALFNCLFYNPTTCVHRRVLELTPTWRDANQSTGADDEWFERLIAAGARFAVLPEPAILYRRIGSSNSRRFGELTRQFRVRLRCRAVKRLFPDATEQELAIHGCVVARDPSLCREDLPDVRAWFERLLAADMSQVHYGKKELNWILGVNWQRACALVACHDLGAAVHAYCSFDALAANTGSIWPLLYEFQKRKIYQISHHKNKNNKFLLQSRLFPGDCVARKKYNFLRAKFI